MANRYMDRMRSYIKAASDFSSMILQPGLPENKDLFEAHSQISIATRNQNHANLRCEALQHRLDHYLHMLTHQARFLDESPSFPSHLVMHANSRRTDFCLKTFLSLCCTYYLMRSVAGFQRFC